MILTNDSGPTTDQDSGGTVISLFRETEEKKCSVERMVPSPCEISKH